MTQQNLIINDIRLPFKASPEEALFQARIMAKVPRDYPAYIYRRSIDARKKYNICFVYSVKLGEYKPTELDKPIHINSETLSSRPVIAGFGPCGMFAALVLAENGYRPIVVERGSSVNERVNKIHSFYETGVLDTETNVQFGAGGAGTFSDGKLTTRINDPKCRYILERFCEFGAPSEILTDAKPHVGTDRLREIINGITERVIELGGEIHFDTRLDRITYNSGKAVSITTNNGQIPCGALVIAAGHSARDLYALMKNDNFDIINKPFSVGVRIEHLRSDIDRAAYGESAGNPLLGAADYAFSKRVGEKCVYTFCMCPGGEVIAAASEEGGTVVNGMSFHRRSGNNSNAALAVSVSPENPIEFQRSLERAAYSDGYRAPVQTVGDFMKNVSRTEPKRITPSYMNGNYRLFNLNKIFPKEISDMLKLGINEFNRGLSGFSVPDAVLTGVETRTSAPVRVRRNDETFVANGFDNIYPCGEGAGYAGGIMSAAVDGVKCALKIIERYKL